MGFFSDLRFGRVFRSNMARPSANSPGEHDKRVPASTAGVSQQDLETRLVLQKRQKGHLPDHDHTEPLPLVIQGQNNFIHGQVSANFFNTSYV